MARPKKIPDEGSKLENEVQPMSEEEFLAQPGEAAVAALTEGLKSESPVYQTVWINGKEYKQWMDSAGCTFVELL